MESATIEHNRESLKNNKEVVQQTIIENNRIFDVASPLVSFNKKYLFIKRCFDVFAVLIAGILLIIPMLIIALLIHLDSPGTILFRQERLGKDGKPFTILKFRSMRMDAEVDGPQWADKNDFRCTKIGLFIRKTRLDELPQLWNILKGDMSLVGPRPERACFYDEFETYIHGFRNRLVVKPGLTGLAQVNGGY
ncbi:MAG: sugar transferase, partial [Eubacteriales bacterium]